MSRDNLEALKRGLFILWYAAVEMSCFTGINRLAEDSERQIINHIDTLIKNNQLDNELEWMVSHYTAWEFVFDRFQEYKYLQAWIESNESVGTVQIDRRTMMKRGAMGRYWCSIEQ